MSAIQMKATGLLKADPNNPRKSADESGLDRLGDDMRSRGVLVPLLARPDGTIIDGWRRWLAAQRKGIKELPVILTDKPEMEIRGIQLATVFHKADLTGYEKWLACSELMCMNPSWQMKDLAEFLHVDPSSVTRLVSPSRCTQDWQQALRDGKVGISDCYAAAKLPEKEQPVLLVQKLAGASRDAIEQAGRTKRKGIEEPDSEAHPRAPKIKIPLAVNTKELSVNGTATVAGMSGREISLKDAEDILIQAAKAVREAIKQGLDAKTAQAVFRNRAKVGVTCERQTDS